MQTIVQIVSACVKPDMSIPTPDVKSNAVDDGLGEEEIIDEDEEWGEETGNSELIDGPRYGEFEDDLGGEGGDDDE